MASTFEELWEDLEERVRDAFTAEKSKIETEIKDQMWQKSERKAELFDNEKPAAVRSFDLLVKNLNGNSYSMTVINLLTPISVESSSKKKKEKPSHYTETDASEGLMNVLKTIYEDGDDHMKQTISTAWVESREKQAQETEL
ncbi:unnamed protein product [Nyctereutes procyonoides]|uniref:(raccoon dog) hypothetical protein n=1 Tax=Nyctereutes procyonoides TaxID=34880 RepID=A0A811YYI8_NYCPR|nr:unnamed protein product [Nyctereutes procyonoides]